jgi:hypothetical protein
MSGGNGPNSRNDSTKLPGTSSSGSGPKTSGLTRPLSRLITSRFMARSRPAVRLMVGFAGFSGMRTTSTRSLDLPGLNTHRLSRQILNSIFLLPISTTVPPLPPSACRASKVLPAAVNPSDSLRYD